MEYIDNPLKVINILEVTDIREIGSITSEQARNKSRKSPLRGNPRLYQNDTHPTPSNKETPSTMSEYITVKSATKHQLRQSVKDFKISRLGAT